MSILYGKIRVPCDGYNGEYATLTNGKGQTKSVPLTDPYTDLVLPGMEEYTLEEGFNTPFNTLLNCGDFIETNEFANLGIYEIVKNATNPVSESTWVEFMEKGCIKIAVDRGETSSFIGKTIVIANSETPSYSNWKIADFNHDNSKNTVDLIANNTVTTSAFGTSQTYYNSTIGEYMRTTYAEAFSATTKGYMAHMLPYVKDEYSKWAKAKLLSGAEVGGSDSYMATGGSKYPIFTSSSGTAADSSRIRTGASSNWWLRTKNTNNSSYVWYTGSNGALTNNGSYSSTYGVVPCIRFRNPNKELNMTWAEIKTSIQDGTFSQHANVGDTKSFVMNGKTYHAEVVSINDGTGSAASWYPNKTVDFICEELYETTYHYNTSNTNSGGFPSSALKNTLTNTLYPLLPQDLKNVIIDKSHSYMTNTSGSMSTLSMKLWLPTFYEIVGDTHQYALGETSSNNKQYDIKTIIKKLNGQTSAYYWWLGSLSSSSSTYFWCVYSTGFVYNQYASNSYGVPLCFRIG